MARAKAKRVRSRFSWQTFFLGLALLFVIFAAHNMFRGAYERADLIAYDLRLKGNPVSPPTGQIAIATIDDKSISQLGQWPWPRSRLAELVRALTGYKAAVIGFDVIFTEADTADVSRARIAERLSALRLPKEKIRETLGASNDEAFAAAIKAHGATVLGYPFMSHDFRVNFGTDKTVGFLTQIRAPGPMSYGIVRQAPGTPHDLISAQAYLPPVQVLDEAARGIASVDSDADVDGEIRSVMTVIKFADRYCIPLFLGVTQTYAGGAPLLLGIGPAGVTQVAVAGTSIPVDDAGRMLINFRRGKEPFPYYSIVDILKRSIPPAKLAGKIVLVGATAHGLGDRGVTPANPDTPRVEIHAQAIDNLLRGDFLRRPVESEEIVVIGALLIGIAMALSVAGLSALSSAAVLVILAVGYFVYAQQRLAADGMVIGVFFPISTSTMMYMVLVGYRYITEGREKAHMRTAFEHYLHPDVIASLLESRERLKLGGERRHLAILFADIVSFTSRAERTEPEALVALLNTYMTAMIEVILESDGVVDKLMGDGIMAFWGAPNELENPSRSAVDAAIKMLERLAALRNQDPRFEDLDIGIGIATGDVIVGNFGGEQRFDYSVVGDTVNFASRLEGLTRHFKVHLLVSLNTFTEAGSGYIARELGLVKVKGKEVLVPIVEVAGHANDSIDPAFYQRFGDALKLIRQGAAPTALEELRRLSSERPQDTPVHIFLDKLGADPAHPPKDMVFEFESK